MRRLSRLAWGPILVGPGAVLAATLSVAVAAPVPQPCKGRPRLVARRGPVVARVYRAPHGGAGLCAQGYGVSLTGSADSQSRARVPAQAVQVFWAAARAGAHGFVVLFGRAGRDVTAVTIRRSNHSTPVHARLAHGWYVGLWSRVRDTHATDVLITTGPVTRSYRLPRADRRGVPNCGGPGKACAAIGPGQTIGR